MRRFADQYDARVSDPADEARETGRRGARERLAVLCDQSGSETLTVGRVCTTRGALVCHSCILAFPTLLADQRHEAHVGEIFPIVVVLVASRDADQFLRAGIAAHGTTRRPPIFS